MGDKIMTKIYIGSADNTKRPFSIDDPLDEQSLDNWKLLASGDTAIEALTDLVELANDEQFSIENNWLRVIQEDK
jgi:hypothetical protein